MDSPQELAQAAQQTKILEKLKEKQKKRYEKRLQKMEARELDEIGTNVFLRSEGSDIN
jgi:flagellar export protein FliJ